MKQLKPLSKEVLKDIEAVNNNLFALLDYILKPIETEQNETIKTVIIDSLRLLPFNNNDRLVKYQ